MSEYIQTEEYGNIVLERGLISDGGDLSSRVALQYSTYYLLYVFAFHELLCVLSCSCFFFISMIASCNYCMTCANIRCGVIFCIMCIYYPSGEFFPHGKFRLFSPEKSPAVRVVLPTLSYSESLMLVHFCRILPGQQFSFLKS